MCYGKEDKYDPLSWFKLFNTFAASCGIEDINRKIVGIRDGVRRTPEWDPVDSDDNEIDAVRGILLESASDFASLIQEWRFYILSIGRDRYIETAS